MLPLRDAVLDGIALLLPVECVGCGAPDRAVCASCRPALAADPSSRLLADGTPVFSGLDYDGVARQVILGYKEQGRTELARHLVPALAAAVSAAVDAHGRRGLEIVTVPGARRARRHRGFDPVAALVGRAGLSRARVLAPARPHPAQKTLSLEQRAANLAGVFALRAPVFGRRFLVVDDVVTTGATLLAVADALRAGGAEVVAAAAVASTPRLFGTSVGVQRERSVTFP
jgi:ComF family protein